MPLLYCTVHERVFVEKYNQWIPFSSGKISPLKIFYDKLHAAHIEISEYAVIETTCDHCEVAALQKLREH